MALRIRLALFALCACACAAPRGDRWQVADEVFRDGDVVARVDARRGARSLDLRWCGVRAEGQSRLTAVRMVVFTDRNGDLEPQPEEQLAVWDAHSATPVDRFSVAPAFESTNVPEGELELLCVSTEVRLEGRDEPVRQSRALP